ncbi:hypothetical protein BJX62DRAFT_238571 [Aspergillus germanicus]
MATQHPLSATSLFNLKAWVTLVTGGGTGIGLMAAQTLAANGAKVYITGRRKEVIENSAKVHGSEKALGSSGGSIVPLVMDVTSKESISAIVEHITKEDGYLNVLVNNAGIGGDRAHAQASSGADVYSPAMLAQGIDDWQQVYLSNTTQVYYTSAAFVPLLAKSKDSPAATAGNIINITSLSGITKWSQNSQYAYNCSKAAANHLTKMLAYEFCNENIQVRVNAIAPGYFPSELTVNSSDEKNKSTWPQDAFDKEMLRVGANVPTHRPGTDAEMASAILTLATNGYIWGTILTVDGGILLRHPSTA